MNRARIALFLQLDLLTWETGRWSFTYAVRVPGPPAIQRRVDRCYSFCSWCPRTRDRARRGCVIRPFRTSSGGLRGREPDQTSLAFADSLIGVTARRTSPGSRGRPGHSARATYYARSRSSFIRSFKHRPMKAPQGNRRRSVTPADEQDLWAGVCTVARCNGEIIGRKLFTRRI